MRPAKIGATVFSADLEAAVKNRRVPGVVATVGNANGVLYEGAFGERSLDSGVPMTNDTVVWIASMTKALTGAVAMQQVERGRLSLDAPASEVCPYLGEVQVLEGFTSEGTPILRAPKRPVTLRHLLTHTAGFQEGLLGYFIGNDSVHVRSIEEKLRAHIPARVR